MYGRAIALVFLLALSACSTSTPHGAANPVEKVPLDVSITDQSPEGDLLRLTGQVTNSLSETVTGVRVQLVFVAATDENTGKALEIQQTEIDATLAPGASAPLSWDVKSGFLEEGAAQFVIAAYPKRLGDKDMPPPDHWKK